MAFLRIPNHGLAAVVGALSLGLQWAGTPMTLALQFQRQAVLDGQWWRLLSGHLVHLGWGHALLNVAALWLVVWLFGRERSPRELGLLLLAPLLAVDAGLWFLMPGLQWYVGLSGILHGLLAGLLFVQVAGGSRRFLWLIVLVSVKIGWETLFGPLPFMAGAAGGAVIVQAHAFGALGGVAAGLLLWAFPARKHQTNIENCCDRPD